MNLQRRGLVQFGDFLDVSIEERRIRPGNIAPTPVPRLPEEVSEKKNISRCNYGKVGISDNAQKGMIKDNNPIARSYQQGGEGVHYAINLENVVNEVEKAHW